MTPPATRLLGRTGLVVSRLGLGLAAVGRPGYITLGRAHDLPAERTPAAMYRRSAAVLDAAWADGVRYVDVARSYGRAEEFLARWLAERAPDPDAVTVGSKWGYRYTAGWLVDADVHEQKELSRARFAAQLDESRALLGERLALYQIHSATAESGVLGDESLLRDLVDARHRGAFRALGLTLTGATARRTLDLALEARVDDVRVFDVVQATYNVLEPSLRDGLAAAHAEGIGVIVKEAHANGRLTPANARPEDAALRARLDGLARDIAAPIDRLALAFVAAEPWVDVVLSGAATVAQVRSHAAAMACELDAGTRAALGDLAEAPATYWQTRAALAWA
ncbi:MAG: aldo/keto reductase [Deltaproteobacteria bacterium]|nr:aldo/keto reductase [Deltaproteobacteria bacterium]